MRLDDDWGFNLFTLNWEWHHPGRCVLSPCSSALRHSRKGENLLFAFTGWIRESGMETAMANEEEKKFHLCVGVHQSSFPFIHEPNPKWAGLPACVYVWSVYASRKWPERDETMGEKGEKIEHTLKKVSPRRRSWKIQQWGKHTTARQHGEIVRHSSSS